MDIEKPRKAFGVMKGPEVSLSSGRIRTLGDFDEFENQIHIVRGKFSDFGGKNPRKKK